VQRPRHLRRPLRCLLPRRLGHLLRRHLRRPRRS
jgi:hypothetical protein